MPTTENDGPPALGQAPTVAQPPATGGSEGDYLSQLAKSSGSSLGQEGDFCCVSKLYRERLRLFWAPWQPDKGEEKEVGVPQKAELEDTEQNPDKIFGGTVKDQGSGPQPEPIDKQLTAATSPSAVRKKLQSRKNLASAHSPVKWPMTALDKMDHQKPKSAPAQARMMEPQPNKQQQQTARVKPAVQTAATSPSAVRTKMQSWKNLFSALSPAKWPMAFLLLCFLVPTAHAGQVFENIRLEPAVVEVEEGQAVTLYGSVDSQPTAYVTWTEGNKTGLPKHTNSDRIKVLIPPGQDWIIVQFQAYNPTFRYTRNAYALLYRKGMKVQVPQPRLLPVRDRPVRDQTFQLKCDFPSFRPFGDFHVNTSFTLYWNQIAVKSQLSPVFDWASLSKEDDGNYTCVATVGPPEFMSDHSDVYELHALVAPKIHLEPEAADGFITHAAGDGLNLTCQVTEAYPEVGAHNYNWTFQPSSGSLPQNLSETTNTLMLGPMTREKAGEYWCQAWNDPALPPGNASVAVRVGDSHSTNVPAIVGGVVGVVAIIALIIYCVTRRARREIHDVHLQGKSYERPRGKEVALEMVPGEYQKLN